MNAQLFEKNYTILQSLLERNQLLLGPKEVISRKKRLEKIYNYMIKEDVVCDSYYSIDHEIRTIDFFSGMGHTIVAKDSQHDPGVDLIYNDNLIECTVSTSGEDNNREALIRSGYQEYNKLIDYNVLSRQISLRILSSIASKRSKYINDIQKKVINQNIPFCIFLSLGRLQESWFGGELCKEATRFLVGRGHPTITIDTETNKLVGGVTYGYAPTIQNNNSAEVETNFFVSKENSMVSAVIITTAQLDELYSKNNMVIFTNPYAKNKIKVRDFNKIPYWKMNKSMEYVPRISGKQRIMKGL